jgi:hypothetical protein
MLQSSQINIRTNNNYHDEDVDANNIKNSNNNQNYHMTIKQIQIVLKNKKLLNYSLHQLSMKKINQLRSKHIISDDDIEDNKFYHSDILHDYEAKDLFFNLPFFIKSPKIKKIYSTLQHIRSLDHMYAKTVKVMMMILMMMMMMMMMMMIAVITIMIVMMMMMLMTTYHFAMCTFYFLISQVHSYLSTSYIIASRSIYHYNSIRRLRIRCLS